MMAAFILVLVSCFSLTVPVLLPSTVAHAATTERPLTKATITLQWLPQSQFAGYYVALDKGFYRNKGLDVNIRHGGPKLDSMDALADHSSDFATTFLISALRRRDNGLPLINIAQIVQHSTAMFIVRKKSGINSLRDLDGKRISLWKGNLGVPLQAILASQKITPGRIFDQNYSVNLFLHSGVDACSAMYYNEYDMLYQAGLDKDELLTFPLRDYDADIPEDGIYCLESTWNNRPEQCRAFREATLEGWRYARAHPDEALESVMKRVFDAHLPTNRSHMKWMLEKILTVVIPGTNDSWQAGALSRGDYAKAVELMKRQELIHNAPSYDRFHPTGGPHVP
jgi:NitT/TauT family transport system substrate-binding protein